MLQPAKSHWPGFSSEVRLSFRFPALPVWRTWTRTRLLRALTFRIRRSQLLVPLRSAALPAYGGSAAV